VLTGFGARCRHRLLAGQEHDQTIPLGEVADSQLCCHNPRIALLELDCGSATVAEEPSAEQDETWLRVRNELLRAFDLTVADKLGAGGEAEVYAVDRERVLRLHKPQIDRSFIQRRKTFYDCLAGLSPSIMLPTILEHGERDIVSYDLERRIPGVDLAIALSRMEGAVRRRALLTYTNTAAIIRTIKYEQNDFGEVLAANPIRRDSWADFIMARAQERLAAGYSRLKGKLDRPERALKFLNMMLPIGRSITPQLVHGDYHLANVIVDETGNVTGLTDFGRLTVVGDPDMDLAGAVLNLTGVPGVTADDKRGVFERAQALGLSETALSIYKLYYAIYFLERGGDGGLFYWCLEIIRAACEA
jgi:hypothetical protein